MPQIFRAAFQLKMYGTSAFGLISLRNQDFAYHMYKYMRHKAGIKG